MNEYDSFKNAEPVKIKENFFRFDLLEGSQHCYLIIGTKRAIMIDTGWGPCNLYEKAKELTSLPIDVINTHGHLDHVGGNLWFDGTIYQHENCDIDFRISNGDSIKGIPFTHKENKVKYVKDGNMIDLGDNVLEIIEIPAHSLSSIAILDRKHRMLFVGDEIESGQVLMFGYDNEDISHYISKHKANMEKLLEFENDFELLCPGHNGSPISKEYIKEYIDLDNAVLDGSAKEKPLSHKYLEKDPEADRMYRVRLNKASFILKRPL